MTLDQEHMLECPFCGFDHVHFDVESERLDRGHQAALVFWCEGCGGRWRRMWTEHKGQVFAYLHDMRTPAIDVSKCDSPIEELMLRALASVAIRDGHVLLGEGWCSVPGLTDPPPEWLTVAQQVKIPPYRADFVLRATKQELSSRLVVECDGHAFHERTKAQARRDKKRDRKLLAAGYPTVRFTGSEIHADADACATEVIALVRSRLP